MRGASFRRGVESNLERFAAE